MSDELGFLDALKANPADDTARLVYADWLDEHDEPAKAEYLRLVVGLSPHLRAESAELPNVSRLLTLAESLPLDWRFSAAARFLVLIYGYGPGHKINIIKLVRQLTGMGLKEAKDFVESLPARFPMMTTLENAIGLRDQLRGDKTVRVGIHPSDIAEPPRMALYSLSAELSLLEWNSEGAIPPEAFDCFAEFLATALNVSREQAIGVVREVPFVQLDTGLEPAQLERRINELNSLLPPPDPGRDWGIILYPICQLTPPSTT